MTFSLATLLFSPSGQGFDLFQGKDSNILSQRTGENFQTILKNILQSQNGDFSALQSDTSKGSTLVNFQQFITSLLNQQNSIIPSSLRTSAIGTSVPNEYNLITDVLNNSGIIKQPDNVLIKAIEQLLSNQNGRGKSSQLNNIQDALPKSKLLFQNNTLQNNPLLSVVNNAVSLQLPLHSPEIITLKNNKIQLPIQIPQLSEGNSYVLELPVQDLMSKINQGKEKNLSPVPGFLVPVKMDESSSDDESVINITAFLPTQLIEVLHRIIQPAAIIENWNTLREVQSQIQGSAVSEKPLNQQEHTSARLDTTIPFQDSIIEKPSESIDINTSKGNNGVIDNQKPIDEESQSAPVINNNNEFLGNSENDFNVKEFGSLGIGELLSLGVDELNNSGFKINNITETIESSKISKDIPINYEKDEISNGSVTESKTVQTGISEIVLKDKIQNMPLIDFKNSSGTVLPLVQDGVKTISEEVSKTSSGVQDPWLNFTFKLDMNFGLVILPITGNELPVTKSSAEDIPVQTEGLKTLLPGQVLQLNSNQIPDVSDVSISPEIIAKKGMKVPLPYIFQAAFEKASELKDVPKFTINSSYLENLLSLKKDSIPESLIVPVFFELAQKDGEIKNISDILGKGTIPDDTIGDGKTIQADPSTALPIVDDGEQVPLPAFMKVSRAVIEYIQSNPDLQRIQPQKEITTVNSISVTGNEIKNNQEVRDYPLSLLNDIEFMISEYSTEQKNENPGNEAEYITNKETNLPKNELPLQWEYLHQQSNINVSGINSEQNGKAQVNIGENTINKETLPTTNQPKNLSDVRTADKYDEMMTLILNKNISKNVWGDPIIDKNEAMKSPLLNSNITVHKENNQTADKYNEMISLILNKNISKNVWGDRIIDKNEAMKSPLLNSNITVNKENNQTADKNDEMISLISNPNLAADDNVLRNNVSDISEEKMNALDGIEKSGGIKIIDKKLIVIPREKMAEPPVPPGTNQVPISKNLQWNMAEGINNFELQKNAMENTSANIKSDIQDGESKAGRQIQDIPNGAHPLSSKETHDSGKLFIEHLAKSSQISEQNFEPLIQRVKYMTKEGITDLQMDLNPPDLGKVHIRVTSEQSEMIARIGVENHTIKALFEEHLPKLQESLQSSGVNVQQLDVYVRDDGGESARFAFEKSHYGERRNHYNQQGSKSYQNEEAHPANNVFKSRGYNSWELVA